MAHKIIDTGVSKNIGKYSDAIEVEPGLRWLHTSGTPGLTASGELPSGIEAQSRLAWENVLAALDQAGMTVDDIVKVTTWLIDPSHIRPYAAVRSEFLGALRPAFMLQVVNQLVWPEILLEIEVVAAKR